MASAVTTHDELRRPDLAQIFISEGQQAVRLPKGFCLEGDSVAVRQFGSSILLEPLLETKVPTREELRAFWERLDSYRADSLFPEGRDQGTFEVRDPIK